MAKGKKDAVVGQDAPSGVKVGTVAGAAQIQLTGTVVGKSEGVEYLATADGFAVVFRGTAPHQTKYGTPCYHFGGRGQDRPAFALPDGRTVAVNPGTLSVVPGKEVKEERKQTARLDKVLGDIDPVVLAKYLASRGASVQIEE